MESKENISIKYETEETANPFPPVNIKIEQDFLLSGCKAEPFDPVDDPNDKYIYPGSDYGCTICPYATSQEKYLKKHLRKHLPNFGHTKLSCSICGYAGNERSDLKRHMLVHTGEKPFACDLCPFRCRQKGYLKDHMKTHAKRDANRLHCNHCNFSTIWRGSLIMHLKIHKVEKPYRCAECNMTFSVRSYLKKHMFIHTKEKPYKCDYCDYKAYRNYHLKVHFRKHAKDIVKNDLSLKVNC